MDNESRSLHACFWRCFHKLFTVLFENNMRLTSQFIFQHDVIMLDDDFSEKEKTIVKKNALKKQKTLSQM
jgi:hypothetical protein